LEHRILPRDDPADLEERLLELLLRLGRPRSGRVHVLGHASSLLSRLRGSYVSTDGGGFPLAGGEAPGFVLGLRPLHTHRDRPRVGRSPPREPERRPPSSVAVDAVTGVSRITVGALAVRAPLVDGVRDGL